jgi:hypothetical protein
VRTASWLAWGLWAACLTLVALSVFFAALSDFATPLSAYLPNLLASALSFSTVGALIASRRRDNPMGWLLLGAGLLWSLMAFGGEYGFAVAGDYRPGGLLGLWFGSWGWIAAGAVVLFSFLYFPDGRLPSPRWRLVVLLFVLAVAIDVVPIAFAPGPLLGFAVSGSRNIVNPFGVEAFDKLSAFATVVTIPTTAVTCLPVLALVVRYLHATEEGRQQIKWVAYAVALLAAVITATTIWPPLDGSLAGLVLFLVGYQAIPAAVGIAVLRHRLYDIDLLINRTLVYGALSAALILVYAGSVVSIQYGLRSFTGGDSQLAVVASTLIIAALFNPLRRRTQDLVDRRFYRKKYDAARVLEDFAATLKTETDLQSLEGELVGAVTRAVQPEHASLWLRQP